MFVLLAGMAFLSFTRPTYACLNTFDPTPAPSFVAPSPAPVGSGATPAPAVTPPPPGFVQPDMGHVHADPGSTVNYRFCPPASGRHYNSTAVGPIPAGVYGPDEQPVGPPGWVHNLEHGALVLLYKCPGPACDEAGQQALEDLFQRWPASPICGFEAGTRDTPVFVRFDEMPWNYAALVWDVVLPMETLDEPLLLEFFNRQAERFAPERFCPLPTPTPGPATPTPVPTASPAGTPAPTGSAPADTPPPATTGPSPS